MPGILDNIDLGLLPALRETMALSTRADYCVGYFKVAGLAPARLVCRILARRRGALLSPAGRDAVAARGRVAHCLGPRSASGLLIDSVDSKPCKSILDEIDCVLAEHYGFTDEELDFIINYDLEYRMGSAALTPGGRGRRRGGITKSNPFADLNDAAILPLARNSLLR